ncbi:hypothetical protein [Deinococcus sonorensis]|uniref:Uncharacterized protein n=2 Tax=Deinococcus sonorensis TaxID=309891 RepID=A0AAU7UAT8_9DEIO
MKKWPLLTLAVLLGACSTTPTPTSGSGTVTVAADKSAIVLAADGTSASSATTKYTFTNGAGAGKLNISKATLTSAGVSTDVALPTIVVPAGVSCTVTVSPCPTGNVQFGPQTVEKALNDADVFGKLVTANAGKSSFPVTVSFPGVSNTLNFTVSAGSASTPTDPTVPAAPSPVIVVTSSGTAPYSKLLGVNVSGGFAAGVAPKQMVLTVTGADGLSDSASYVSTQSSATFSVDTTKFPNGALTMQVTAIDANSQIGKSAVKTVQIANRVAPTLTINTPVNGSTTTLTSQAVQFSVMKKNSAFSVTGGTATVELLDYRGKIVDTRTVAVTDNVDGNYTADAFDMAGLPADTYTVHVKLGVTLDPGTATAITQALDATSQVTTNTTSVLPPAATIRFPAITNNRTPGRIDSSSGFMVDVSDNTGVSVVEARIVGPYDATKALALNGTTQCQESQTVPGSAPVNVLLLNQGFNPPLSLGSVVLPSIDIDGSAYVPDNAPNQRYDMRVTAVDTDGNRNIQCIPVLINRAATKAARISYTTSVVTNPSPANTRSGQLNYSSGNFTIGGITSSSRVTGVLYQNGARQSMAFTADATGSVVDSVGFGAAGTYQVVWIVEDMNTGIVTQTTGPSVSVIQNP